MADEISTFVSTFEWVARGLSTVAAPIAIVCGYILHRNDKRVSDIECRVDEVEKVAYGNKLDIKDTEVKMAELRTHVSENFSSKVDMQSSLARVHEKIEEGNRKTDQINESVGNKIDQLRRDLREDIRLAIQQHG